MYSIDYIKFITRNAMQALRQTLFIAWVFQLLKPQRTLDVEFEELRDEIIQQYNFNGLKHSIEWLLNDRYDTTLRRIEIVALLKTPFSYWQDESDVPLHYWSAPPDSPTLFWLSEDDWLAASTTDYEFTIRVPEAVEFNAAELILTVETYRWAGLRPRLVTFDADNNETIIDISNILPT